MTRRRWAGERMSMSVARGGRWKPSRQRYNVRLGIDRRLYNRMEEAAADGDDDDEQHGL
jgi:hypothetical protein